MTSAAMVNPPGLRPCPACGCCQFGLCMLASRDMNECSSLSDNPPQTRGCPCSAVLRRPLISVVPHVWDPAGGPCRRCHAARTADVVPNCWYHPHEAARGGLCKWCSLHVADPGTPLDCPGMPRVMHIYTGAAFLAQVTDFLTRDPEPADQPGGGPGDQELSHLRGAVHRRRRPGARTGAGRVRCAEHGRDRPGLLCDAAP